MKIAKLAYLLAVTLTLSLAATGCRKGLDKTTEIPNRGIVSPSERSAPPIDSTPPIGVGNNGNNGNPLGQGVTGNPLGTGTGTGVGTDTNIKPVSGTIFDGWNENREEFSAQTVRFDFDSAVIKKSEVGKLEEVARRMKANFAGKALRIEGHCDERGTEEYNRALGDRRALSIREKLVALGLDSQMLPTISYGEDKPVDTGHTDAAFKKNRRGELILLTPP